MAGTQNVVPGKPAVSIAQESQGLTRSSGSTTVPTPARTPTPPPGAQAGARPMAPGDSVRLVNLTAAPHLNGQTVVLVQYSFEKQRWIVKREDGSSVGVSAASLQ